MHISEVKVIDWRTLAKSHNPDFRYAVDTLGPAKLLIFDDPLFFLEMAGKPEQTIFEKCFFGLLGKTCYQSKLQSRGKRFAWKNDALEPKFPDGNH